MEMNFNYLFQYLEKENIIIDKSEFVFQVESHPNYPSLLSISDTLSFLKVENLVTRLETENLKHLPEKFIALVKEKGSIPFLAYIERLENGYQYIQNNKKENITVEQFKENFQNIVLLAEKVETN